MLHDPHRKMVIPGFNPEFLRSIIGDRRVGCEHEELQLVQCDYEIVWRVRGEYWHNYAEKLQRLIDLDLFADAREAVRRWRRLVLFGELCPEELRGPGEHFWVKLDNPPARDEYLVLVDDSIAPEKLKQALGVDADGAVIHGMSNSRYVVGVRLSSDHASNNRIGPKPAIFLALLYPKLLATGFRAGLQPFSAWVLHQEMSRLGKSEVPTSSMPTAVLARSRCVV